MEAEYVALTKAAKKCVHFRQLMGDLGFPQRSPSIVYEDNRSAINLAKAPEITKNSKHIQTRFHYIRDLVKQRLVEVQYLPTDQMTADLLTKPLATTPFLYLRSKLLNSSDKPIPAWSTLRGECQKSSTTAVKLAVTEAASLAAATIPSKLPDKLPSKLSGMVGSEGIATSELVQSQLLLEAILKLKTPQLRQRAFVLLVLALAK
jgi:hypothetical protein